MRTLLRAGGILVTIASLVFVGYSIHLSLGQLTEDLISASFMVVVSVLSLLYAAALQLIGIAWHEMIIAVDGKSLSRSKALAIFNRSQVYKYLPGNLFHMVGRYSLAKSAGASHQALTFAQIGEIAIISFAALSVAVTFSTTILTYYTDVSTVAAIAAVSLVAFAVAAVIATKVGVINFDKAAAVTTLRVFVIYLLFFVVNGLMAVGLLTGLHNIESGWILPTIGIASGAWLLGFIVPGAPGGLGAREAVMIGGITAMGIPASTATAVAIGHRIATVAGDALVALIEFVSRPKEKAVP